MKGAQEQNQLELDLDISGRIMDRLSRDDSLWNTEFWTYRQLQNMRSSVDGIYPIPAGFCGMVGTGSGVSDEPLAVLPAALMLCSGR